VLATTTRCSSRPWHAGAGAGLPPISTIEGRFAEKQAQVLFEQRLIAFSQEDVVTAKTGDVGATGPLRMHGVCRDNPPVDDCRGEQDRLEADLVALGGNRVLGKHYSCLRLVERHQMHRGLVCCQMPASSSQRLPIQGDMDMLFTCLGLTEQPTGFHATPTRGSQTGQQMSHHLEHLLVIHHP